MFKQTTTVYKIKDHNNLLNTTYENIKNDIKKLLTNKIELMDKVEEQKRYKKNKEFLYANCNKIKRRFYHYRDTSNFPRVTVCVLYDENAKIACRGLSLCSFSESPIKEVGRDISEDRAITAYITMMESEKISNDETKSIINSLVDQDLISFDFKSCFDIELTEFEKRLFNIQ